MNLIVVFRVCLAVCVCSAELRCWAQYLERMFPPSRAEGLTRAERERADAFTAIEDGDKTRVLTLLQGGLDPNGRDEYSGIPLLHASADFKRIEVMRALLDKGARPNGRAADGRTALMDAARGAFREGAKLLLARGARVNMRSKHGETALMCAAESEDPEMVRMLLRAGAGVNPQDEQGVTALMLGVGSLRPVRYMHTNACEVLRLLLDHKARINVCDRNGLTALARAVDLGDFARQTEPARLLLERGANPNSQNEGGETPLMYACGDGYAEMVQLLLEHGAAVNAQAKDGATALHRASEHGEERIVALLLKHSARADLKDRSGKTAGDLAAERGFKELAEKLKRAERETKKPKSRTDEVSAK